MARSFESAAEDTASGAVVARSPAMRALLAEARRLARFDVPVLIEGETGSGKELLARYLHQRSPRRMRPLIAVNCAAIPEGLLEAEFFGHARGAFTGAESARPGLLAAADRGTLFLDEVGELPARGQSLLLRALQEREFRRVGDARLTRSDFRLLAATHRPLGALAASGGFRADLYYRLGVVRLRLPPLRERRDEIPELAAALLARVASRHRVSAPQLSSDALERLVLHDWPGNVRELESLLAAALLRRPDARTIEAEQIAALLPESKVTEETAEPLSDGLLAVLAIRRLATAREALERLLILRALARAAGNRAQAARDLGISRQGLWQKLRRHGIG